MKKRIYLSIIYFITLICIIIGVLGNVFNISPFTRMTMASSGKYIENSSIYDNVSDIIYKNLHLKFPILCFPFPSQYIYLYFLSSQHTQHQLIL